MKIDKKKFKKILRDRGIEFNLYKCSGSICIKIRIDGQDVEYDPKDEYPGIYEFNMFDTK